MSVRALRRGTMAGRGAAAGPPVGNVLHLDLPGTSGNYVSTPDSPANSITGDIDIRVKVALTDWTPAAYTNLVGKWGGSGSFSYQFRVSTFGVLSFRLSANGTTLAGANASAALGFTDGTTQWLRVTWNNATDTLTYFTSADGSSWTQFGTSPTLAAAGIFDSTAPVELGSSIGGTNELLDGNLYWVEIRDGIDGTVVQTFDATTVTKTATRTPNTADYGGPWTANGTTWDWVT